MESLKQCRAQYNVMSHQRYNVSKTNTCIGKVQKRLQNWFCWVQFHSLIWAGVVGNLGFSRPVLIWPCIFFWHEQTNKLQTLNRQPNQLNQENETTQEEPRFSHDTNSYGIIPMKKLLFKVTVRFKVCHEQLFRERNFHQIFSIPMGRRLPFLLSRHEYWDNHKE